jgi:hypothetical protein
MKWVQRSRISALVLVVALMSVTLAARGRDEERPSIQEIARRAEMLRPTAQELRWQQIPWVGSLTVARDTAHAERRPIFVWTLDEDPFDRC